LNVEFDEDMLGPDDLREAYEAELAARAETRASVPGMLVLVQQWSLRTYDVASAIAELAPGRSRVVRLATTPARALMYLGFGGWNDCPNPHEQARVWEHWANTVGGAPALVEEDALTAIIERPPATRDALVRMAREVTTYCGDSVIEGRLPLLAMLYRSTNVRFWTERAPAIRQNTERASGARVVHAFRHARRPARHRDRRHARVRRLQAEDQNYEGRGQARHV